MRKSHRITALMSMVALLMLVMASVVSADSEHDKSEKSNNGKREGLHFVLYRSLEAGADGILLMDFDPESETFGEILQRYDVGEGVLLHHLYFNADETRLYSTALGGANLYEVILDHETYDYPYIVDVQPIDTQGNIVGEDIYFTRDGSRYYVTFMGGQGGDQGGSVGVFDAQTNELIESIIAPIAEDGSLDTPFILYPHGISANEEVGILMVTSTIHHDLTTGIGNTVTAIDMETNQPLKTYRVSDSAEDFSSPVEVILLRDEYPDFALVNTMVSGDVWISEYNEELEAYEEFSKLIDGSEVELGWPLEFYVYNDELYISFGVPGVVNVYSLENLPELTLKRSLPASAGAHHMAFFETDGGREVAVFQNNLLNLDGLNSGLLSVVDLQTGEVLGTVDLVESEGLMPENVESAFGHGHDLHH